MSHSAAKPLTCSPAGRVKQFGEPLHVSEGLSTARHWWTNPLGTLFCRACQHSLACGEKDTLVDHLKSVKHLNNLKRKTTCHQVSLVNTAQLKVHHEFTQDVTKFLAYADIPIGRWSLHLHLDAACSSCPSGLVS